MPGIDRTLVEHKLPTRSGVKPIRQAPRRITGEVVTLVQEEIQKLLRVGFIRTARYVEWISSIVLMKKKNGKIRVCIDFRDLSRSTHKRGLSNYHL